MKSKKLIKLLQYGMCDYQTGLDYQQSAKDYLIKNGIGSLILLQHKPVYTVGIRKYKYQDSRDSLIVNKNKLLKLGAEFFETNRGGLITFHGPGQLVVYPIFNLKEIFCEYGQENINHKQIYINHLINTMTEVSRFYGAQSVFSKLTPSTLTGSWFVPNTISPYLNIDDCIGGNDIEFMHKFPKKLGALGVRFSEYITSHGIAYNSNVDLTWYDHIDPCGLNNTLNNSLATYMPVTSLSAILGKEITVENIIPIFLKIFKKYFCIDYID